jgi:hypothetical protein
MCWLHWKNIRWQHWMFLVLFIVCSGRVSALLIVLSCPPGRFGKWEDLSGFERGQIVGACLPGASVARNAAMLDVARATVSQVMSAYGDNISQETASYVAKDCSEESQKCRGTGDFRIVYSWLLKTLSPQELSTVSVTKPVPTVQLQIPNFWWL